MNAKIRHDIVLEEYKARRFGHNVISETVGTQIYSEYGTHVDVQFPSPRTENEWQLTSRGWVGYIPLSDELGISLQPRVLLGNLFRMLEYAYSLDEFEFLEDLTGCRSIQDFYESLASVLAKRVLGRAKKGLYRQYTEESETLPYIRGRWDVRRAAIRPWDVKPHCDYQEHTRDNEENQILAWTLLTIIRSQMCTEHVLPFVRKAYRAVAGPVKLEPKSPASCLQVIYNRLNEDYRPMHALCRFFLEHSGPTHKQGEKDILPFLVDMARLFERFIAEWLIANSPPGVFVNAQDHVNIDDAGDIQFKIDLVITDTRLGHKTYVLDTKYKLGDRPDARDVEQIIAYAVAKRCREAILAYPRQLSSPIDRYVEDIRVRTIGFPLEGDLEESGRHFMADVGFAADTESGEI